MSIIATDFIANTTCPYCGVGCGVSVNKKDNQITVKGNADHPANLGRLCVKGSSLHETLVNDNRLVTPKIHGEEVSWDQALTFTSDKFKKIINKHGSDAVAFYVSGQLLTEDYYVANKLMKGFLGSANIDTNSRLCMSSAVVAHKRAFGNDVVPGCYEDFEEAEVIVFVGSNAAYAHPIIFQRIVKAQKQKGTKIVVIDPRRTATCEVADLHLPIASGSDAYFFNGLLAYLYQNDYIDEVFIQNHCDGFDDAISAAMVETANIEDVALACKVNAKDIQTAFEWFAQNPKVVTIFSQGINQSATGTDKGNAIINCHLATGKIGKPGATPFSITGQPNAMGGREVGGLANQLAAHMDFANQSDVQYVSDFWQAQNMASKQGLKAIDMFNAVNDGKIKAIWIMATNPVVSMPNADFVKQALQKCELVVVSDCMSNTDTAKLADVLLPASTWSEKQGTVTNSERRISLQKGFIEPPGQAKHDWEIMCDFAKKMGFGEAFDYKDSHEIFVEHAKLSGINSSKNNAFDISNLETISKEEYLNFKPIQWPVTKQLPNGQKRMFCDGKFFTDNGKAKMIAIKPASPIHHLKKDQLILNTGRIRDQWHTMTRTGSVNRLHSHTPEPFVQIHPSDAQRLNIQDQQIIQLDNNSARFLAKAAIDEEQQMSMIFAPIHWSDAFASAARVDSLVPAIVDQLSGQPQFKSTAVTVSPFKAKWHGLLFCNSEVEISFDYWCKNLIHQSVMYTLADLCESEFAIRRVKNLFAHIKDWVSVKDAQTDHIRLAGFKGEKLELLLFISPDQTGLVDKNWPAKQIGESFTGVQRYQVLTGQDQSGAVDVGAIICSCFQIGENQIKQAIKEGCTTSEALGRVLKCGTNCGSCIPELDKIIQNT
ncbi:molybdopterin-dependent oxidoreductase [Marinicellulosiphila megalodicopiae]|uniref:nitrate reductase n=1 Tax=Marinicellulosiphila megalodicopiae TaxID=2724896 RepID=UPI003BB08CD0